MSTDQALCEQAQAIVKRVDWPCEIKTLFRTKNLGCKLNVSQAITWFFNQEPEGIILEDDCVPNQSFFSFCQKMLERYRDDERIMMITGTNYLLHYSPPETDYFFSRHFTIWGWASWARAWKHYDVKMSDWSKLKKTNQLKYLTYDSTIRRHFEQTFDMIEKNLTNTWDIQWVFACFFNNGLAIIPKCNMISNIGVEGVHAKKVTVSHFYPLHDLDTTTLRAPALITPDAYFDMKLHDDKSRPAVFRRSFYLLVRNTMVYRWYKQLCK